jgi:hypothetical protein
METRILRAFGLGLAVVLVGVLVYHLVTPATASAQGNESVGSVVVLCSSCGYPGLGPNFLVLMDARSGEVWGYSQSAVTGKEKPVYIGTFTAVGQPIVKKNS